MAILCASEFPDWAKHKAPNATQTLKIQTCSFLGIWMLPCLCVCFLSVFFHHANAPIFNNCLLATQVLLILLIILYWLTARSLYRHEKQPQSTTMPWLVSCLYWVGFIFFGFYLLDHLFDSIHGLFASRTVTMDSETIIFLISYIVATTIPASLCLFCLTWIKKRMRWSRITFTLLALLLVIIEGMIDWALALAYQQPYLYSCSFLIFFTGLLFLLSMAWHPQVTNYIRRKSTSAVA